MIIVKHTKTHGINIRESKSDKRFGDWDEILVAPAKLMLVECSRHEAVLRQVHGEGKYWVVLNVNGWLNSDDKFYKPIFISETEKIKVGDSVVDEEKTQIINNIIQDIIKSINSSKYKWFKILALPEHFSPEILSKIVSGELKDGDRILLEVEEI